METLKVLELFGGIGAPRKALERLGINYEVVDYVEIDKYAVKSYNAIYNENYEPQDIMEWNKDLDVDLIFHGSPCQDFSLAGTNAGGDVQSGTRSSLMWETLRIVGKLKPKYVIWENVKNVLSVKHRHNFDMYLARLEELGYVNYYQVLNAKDYGIPQNRERVFVISILDEHAPYEFPEKKELKLRLKDMLESEVDEKYYLSEKMISYIIADNEKWTGNNSEALINKDIATTINTGEGSRRCDASNYVSDKFPNNYNLKEVSRLYGIFDTEKSKHQAGSVYDKNGLSPTLDTMQGGWRQPCIEVREKNNYITNKYKDFINKNGYVPEMFNPYNNKEITDVAPTQSTQCGSTTSSSTILIKEATKKGYAEAYEGDSINLEHPNSTTRRGRVGNQMSQTLTTSCNQGVVENLRIRKLTPLECWRLMGFDDEDCERASEVNSNTQLYKQAGNSIVVNVLEAIFENLLRK